MQKIKVKCHLVQKLSSAQTQTNDRLIALPGSLKLSVNNHL